MIRGLSVFGLMLAAGVICAAVAGVAALGFGEASRNTTPAPDRPSLHIETSSADICTSRTAQRVATSFAAAEAFKVGKAIGSRTLGTTGLNFQKHFLSVVEKETDGVPIGARTLDRAAEDISLIKMLGGESKATVSLPAVYRIIALGSEGDSHTDGRSNFAYVRSSADGRLWAIHWIVNQANEWVVGAASVPHPELDWPAGSRLFSRAITDAKEGH